MLASKEALHSSGHKTLVFKTNISSWDFFLVIKILGSRFGFVCGTRRKNITSRKDFQLIIKQLKSYKFSMTETNENKEQVKPNKNPA